MKIVIRTLIILAAALVVVGATMAYASSGLAGSGDFGRGRDGFEGRPPAGFGAGPGQPGFESGSGAGRPEGFGDRRAGGRRAGGRGMFSAAELVKNLAVIAVIIAVVSLLSRAVGALRPRRR